MTKTVELYPIHAHEQRRSNTLIYAPFPLGGGLPNTRKRYAALANAADADLVAAHSPGTGKVYIDRATRKSLRSGRLERLVETHAPALMAYASDEGYQYMLGLGDSGRAIWVAKMALAIPGLFTHVLTRDGANLHAPELSKDAIRRLLDQGGHRGETTGVTDAPMQEKTEAERRYLIACKISEIFTHHHLMTGMDSRKAHQQLAYEGTVPFCNVTLGEGIGGSETTTGVGSVVFNDTLAMLRMHSPSAYPAPFLGIHEAAWGHGNLMDIAGGADHIQQALAMTGATARLREV